MKLNFVASPGIAVVKEIEEKDSKDVILTQKKEGRIIKGEIISMGSDTTGSGGEPILANKFGSVGDIVWFLHYFDEGGVDVGIIDGIKYLFVKWGDFRAKQL
jgi:co-chaperonin GroES (HSP10)